MSRWLRAGVLAVVLLPTSALAQDRSVGVAFGLIQPIVLRGGNVEVDFRWRRLVVAYSHGWSLSLPVAGEQASQHLRVFLPYSTGLGVGAQHYFERAGLIVDLRAELKLHRFEVSVENAAADRAHTLIDYSTVTLGAGLYLTWLPFAHADNPTLRGINVGIDVRLWPRIWSSLDDDQHTYTNETTARTETHHASDIGIANTPFLFNLSIGYLFTL